MKVLKSKLFTLKQNSKIFYLMLNKKAVDELGLINIGPMPNAPTNTIADTATFERAEEKIRGIPQSEFSSTENNYAVWDDQQQAILFYTKNNEWQIAHTGITYENLMKQVGGILRLNDKEISLPAHVSASFVLKQFEDSQPISVETNTNTETPVTVTLITKDGQVGVFMNIDNKGGVIIINPITNSTSVLNTNNIETIPDGWIELTEENAGEFKNIKQGITLFGTLIARAEASENWIKDNLDYGPMPHIAPDTVKGKMSFKFMSQYYVTGYDELFSFDFEPAANPVGPPKGFDNALFFCIDIFTQMRSHKLTWEEATKKAQGRFKNSSTNTATNDDEIKIGPDPVKQLYFLKKGRGTLGFKMVASDNHAIITSKVSSNDLIVANLSEWEEINEHMAGYYVHAHYITESLIESDYRPDEVAYNDIRLFEKSGKHAICLGGKYMFWLKKPKRGESSVNFEEYSPTNDEYQIQVPDKGEIRKLIEIIYMYHNAKKLRHNPPQFDYIINQLGMVIDNQVLLAATKK